MPVKEKLRKALKRSKIIRYKAYKKAGFVRYRRRVDIALMFFVLLTLVTVSFFFIQPNKEIEVVLEPTQSSIRSVNEEAQEVVHSDLGDDPVIEAKSIDLRELEQRVALGDAEMKAFSLEKGDTILSLLARGNLSGTERMEITDALSLVIDVRSLQPGTSVFIFEDAQENFLGLSIPVKGEQIIGVVKEEDGSYTPVSQEGRIEKTTERIQGTLERTFAGSARKAGISDAIISQITGVLDGEIDFSSDVRSGDKFDIIVEKTVTQSGLEFGEEQLIFIGLQTKNTDIYRYAYTNQSGTPAFYDPRGRSGSKTLYKRPVKGRTRLSSPYGRRRHPVLLYEVFHHGVDLAAPKNTPIVAAADGVITQIGRKGAYGKYIRIKHDGGYQTAYGHMNGYRMGLKTGSRVKRGEVIGYIGSTGRSTGPHVHFEIWKKGKTVNPFQTNVIQGKQLSGFELEQFQSFAESLHPDFQRQLAGKIPPVPAQKPKIVSKSKK